MVFKEVVVTLTLLFIFELKHNGVDGAKEDTCSNYYLDQSCEALRARNLCRMFRRYCRRTCGVCRPITTRQPVTTTNAPLWSPCTKSCGTGTSYKFDSFSCTKASNPKCTRTFRECNRRKCSYKSCNSKQEERFGGSRGCCKKVKTDRRWRGNEKAEKGSKWPWMVLISSFGEVCGGTLIHRQWVMTAAHCVKPGNYRLNPGKIFVYVGVNNITKDAVLKNKYQVRKVVVHPQYKRIQFDVALVRLRVPVSDKKARPLSLPRTEITPIDGTCFATGWGLSELGPIQMKMTSRLKAIQLQILDINVCRKSYHKNPIVGRFVNNQQSPKRFICAGSLTQANDLCHGDSGGPLVCQRCSSCEWYLAGVTPYSPQGTCGRYGLPSMFTKLTGIESWVKRFIPSLDDKPLSCPYQYGP